MTTIIRDDDSRMVKVDGAGFVVRSHDDRLIGVTITEDQRKAMAAALDPAPRGMTLADLAQIRTDPYASVRDPERAARLGAYDRVGWPVGNGGRYPEWMAQVAPEMARVEQEQRARAERAEHARDAAVARAEGLDRDYRECQESLIEVSLERDGWKAGGQEWELLAKQEGARAEKADRERWVHTTPAVSRADIEKAVGDAFDHERDQGGGWPGTVPITNAVYAIVSGDDPAVHVVRESDLPEVERDEDGNWVRGDVLVYGRSAELEMVRQHAASALETVADCEAVARAIEAEQAVDPVEAKAREMLGVAYPGTDGAWPLMREDEREGYRRLAAHVLGQEADQ